MRRTLKFVADALALALVSPAAALCAAERRLNPERESLFAFWAQLLALFPGLPGVTLRRAFYRMTLDAAARSFYVGFGAWFTHRRVVVEPDVYVGAYALVGCAVLRRGCMVGSRASLLSGPTLHELDEHGRWGPSNLELARQLEVGSYALIGEGAIVMADVGESAMVAAGGVVSAPVPRLAVVGGNPARFVRHLAAPRVADREDEVAAHAHAVSTIY